MRTTKEIHADIVKFVREMLEDEIEGTCPIDTTSFEAIKASNYGITVALPPGKLTQLLGPRKGKEGVREGVIRGVWSALTFYATWPSWWVRRPKPTEEDKDFVKVVPIWGFSFAGLERLCTDSGYEKPTVLKGLAALEELGLISRIPKGEDGHDIRGVKSSITLLYPRYFENSVSALNFAREDGHVLIDDFERKGGIYDYGQGR